MLYPKKAVATKLLSPILHAAFWLLFLFISIPQRINDKRPFHPRREMNMEPFPVHDYPFFIITNLIFILFFYWNAEFLIPKVLKKKGLWIYVIMLIGSSAVVFVLNQLIKHYVFHGPMRFFGGHNGMFFFPLLFTFAISTSYRIMSDNLKNEQNQKETETERLKSELSFLRSQISPHFMFNVLNSIVSLARKKSELVEPVVIKLSELMRYMIYESEDDKVNLDKEVKYLQSYIDLQKLRFGNDIEVDFKIENDFLNKAIEPMLLIPFVENAFKHGVGLIINPTIDILLRTDDETLYFNVKNKVNKMFDDAKDKYSGIGLNNVKRRLELLYKDNYTLSVTETQNYYSIELTLKFR